MRLHPIAVMIFLPFAAPAPCSPEVPPETASVTVRLVNTSRACPRILARAARETARVFRRAGILLLWIHCPAETSRLPAGHPCLESPETFHIGIIDKAAGPFSADGLGFALVRAGFRNHAAVHFPRIESLARAWPLSTSLYQTLAFVLAHELGHLFLGTTTHSPTGLMRRACGPDDLQAFVQGRLTFSPEDAAAMRARLAQPAGTHRAAERKAALSPGG